MVAQPGTGWVNCGFAGTTHPYPLEFKGAMRVTVTATGCGGVQLYDWDNNTRFAEHTSPGGLHTLTGITVGNRGPVIRVLNPTEKTEIIVNYEILNPPPCIKRCLRWLGWC